MKRTALKIITLFILFYITSCDNNTVKKEIVTPPDYILVIHGGAGTITKEGLTIEREKAYEEMLTRVLVAGDSMLAGGDESIDVIEKVIMMMEDCQLFNAGKGSVYTAAGTNEMDASIMDGRDLNAGAVGGVTTIKNPISAARRVMDSSKHVLLVWEGAEKFAEDQGLEIVDPEYFFTERSWNRLQRIKETEKPKKHGTVGAVALDKYGNLAAGTSTGGMTNKMYGRIGDSPIIGAGTYASNNSCAVSGTGHGEYFIRNVAAYDVAALMEYKDWPIEKAADFVINDKFVKMNARGGLIAVDTNGNIAMPFNTEGMFRGFVDSEGNREVLMYAVENENLN